MKNLSYSQKLKDPRWQKKRLDVMQRDNFTCLHCQSTKRTLNVHHRFYIRGLEPWEYEDGLLMTLCEVCHASIEDLKKLVGILACNRSVKDRLWAICHGHTDTIEKGDHRHATKETPEAAKECFERMRAEVEKSA